ncbi:hypothetical protein ACWEOS_30055, partial [Micromonospora taraxaci]
MRQRRHSRVGFYRAALFTPVVFSLVVTALVWRVFYQPGLAPVREDPPELRAERPKRLVEPARLAPVTR